MKRLYFCMFLILLILPGVLAIRINEVELNPSEGKYGKEWLELYNEENNDTDISNWTIYDGLITPKKRYTIPEGSIIKGEGYHIIEFTSAVLNNDGDFITLYNSQGEKIDETDTLKESTSSNKTWQLCDSDWKFIESTKEENNKCDNEITEENKTLNEAEKNDTNDTLIQQQESVSQEVSQENTEQEKTEDKSLEIITLTTQTIKSLNDEENEENKNRYAIYGFLAFSILLAVLFAIKKIRYNKNEFR